MIKRCSREYALSLINENKEWNVLDLGAGSDGWKRANVYADIEDHSSSYSKRFVQTQADDTPFEDKEFDFVAATHIAEHVPDPAKFFAELQRISHRGYIETPLPFFCNAAQGNSNPPPHGHTWWVTFDDDIQKLIFKPRMIIVEEFLLPKDTTLLIPFFRDSMVTGVYWEDTVEFEQRKAIFSYEAGNSDAKKRIDLSNKRMPKNVKPWAPFWLAKARHILENS